MSAPLVSICMPCHNAAPYVGEAIDSVLKQSWSKLEIIIVDDSSTDESVSVIRSIRDPRIQLHEVSHRNAAKTRNAAFHHANGEFIKFFDSDDLLSSGLIEAQLERVKNSPNSVASCEWGRFYDDDPDTYRSNPESVWIDLPAHEWLVKAWSRARPMMQPGLFLLPRTLAERVGPWNEQLSLIDDFEYFSRVLTEAESVFFTPDERLLYRSGLNNSLSQRKNRIAIESAYHSLNEGTKRLLGIRGDAEARESCANLLQDFVHTIYPDHPDLRKKLNSEIQALGGSSLPPDGPPNFQRLRRLIGWQAARRVERLVRR
ncbi:MAG: glycosyltransferase family A protein [Verrucomicrobiota bacterium]